MTGKRLTAVFFLLCLLMQTGDRFFVYAGFYLNRQQIAATLCENRNNPAMKCCGKCILRKKLKTTDERAGNESRLNESRAEVLSSKSFFAQTLLPPVRDISMRFTQPPVPHPLDRPADHFHPPGIS